MSNLYIRYTGGGQCAALVARDPLPGYTQCKEALKVGENNTWTVLGWDPLIALCPAHKESHLRARKWPPSGYVQFLEVNDPLVQTYGNLNVHLPNRHYIYVYHEKKPA